MSKPVWHEPGVTRNQRWNKHGLSGATVWLTGLSGSGKSTIANELARELLNTSRLAYILDADNLRHGLNSDLGFSDTDRTENIRRVAEVACLVADSGVVAIVPIISPFAASRDHARKIHRDNNLRFIEVHVATPIAECERRDTKGLYAKVRNGEMTGLSGVDSVYEPPKSPEVKVGANNESLSESVAMIMAQLLVKAGK
ncbi:MAG: adenylyl-sulfate kinase [Actinobacteria bacterium]|nr:adenylyl-sulfate kinase [Actinomycetota bacterium]NCU87771.1 adenylyl-sulfate kinase [Actinomycetota bacterium]NDA97433.1 adenylyl-sulfate kinase [Actinomycetota bacterium]HBQ51401.1 adenylyl-sulfate kinase [Acidimicrobium sp.]